VSNIEQLINAKQGINLELGGGDNPNQGFVNMDILPLDKVDIVWNLERTPWPLPEECVIKAVASHVIEHLSPTYETARLEPLVQLLIKKGIFTQDEADQELGKPTRGFMGIMDELWRVMKPGAQFAFVVPYAESHGMFQDPTHMNFVNETTMLYFDPLDPSGLYQFYHPKPWKVERQYVQRTGLLEVLMTKRPWDESYQSITRPQQLTEELAVKETRLK
jgi:hypothetical protein